MSKSNIDILKRYLKRVNEINCPVNIREYFLKSLNKILIKIDKINEDEEIAN